MLKARWLAPGRRGVLITLTPQGRGLVDTAAAQHLANERRILSGLTAAEQRQLAGLLRKLSLTLPPQEKDEPPAGSGEPDPAADDSQQNTPAGTPRATCAPAGPDTARPQPQLPWSWPHHPDKNGEVEACAAQIRQRDKNVNGKPVPIEIADAEYGRTARSA